MIIQPCLHTSHTDIVGSFQALVEPHGLSACYTEVSKFGGADGSDIRFASYLVELKNAWREIISEVDLINLLYDAVSKPAGLMNQNGEFISVKKGTASKIFSRATGGNVNRAIRQHSNDQAVLSSIEQYFKMK